MAELKEEIKKITKVQAIKTLQSAKEIEDLKMQRDCLTNRLVKIRLG